MSEVSSITSSHLMLTTRQFRQTGSLSRSSWLETSRCCGQLALTETVFDLLELPKTEVAGGVLLKTKRKVMWKERNRKKPTKKESCRYEILHTQSH